MAASLLTVHNLHYMNDRMAALRQAPARPPARPSVPFPPAARPAAARLLLTLLRRPRDAGHSRRQSLEPAAAHGAQSLAVGLGGR